MCTQKSPYNWSEQLYARHGQVRIRFFSSHRTPLHSFCLTASFVLRVLQTMSAYLTDKVLPALKGLHGEPLLAEFVRRGENHAIMNKWHQKFFMYLVSVLRRC
jgi:cullin 1